MPTVARIIAEIAELDPADAPAVLAAVAARLAARPALPPVGPDRTLTAYQVAERLNMSVAWVRENATTVLKSARIMIGGSLRFSDLALEKLIRQRSGE